MDPDFNPFLPVKEIKLQASEVKAVSRKLKTKWGIGSPPVKKTPLKQFVDAIDNPDYDPDNPDPAFEYETVDPVDDLVAVMSKEITREIDSQILTDELGRITGIVVRKSVPADHINIKLSVGNSDDE